MRKFASMTHFLDFMQGPERNDTCLGCGYPTRGVQMILPADRIVAGKITPEMVLPSGTELMLKYINILRLCPTCLTAIQSASDIFRLNRRFFQR